MNRAQFLRSIAAPMTLDELGHRLAERAAIIIGAVGGAAVYHFAGWLGVAGVVVVSVLFGVVEFARAVLSRDMKSAAGP